MTRYGIRLSVLAAFTLGAAGLAGCDRGAAPTPQFAPPPVTVVHPVIQPVQGHYEYNGYLGAIDTVQVVARVKGILEEIHFTEGEEVKKGQPLYSIDKREFETAVKKATAERDKAKADIGSWKAQIDLAKAEVTRAKMAAESSAAAQTDVDKANATLAVNIAELAAAEANLGAAEAALRTANIQLGYTDIRAPIGGLIGRTYVDAGNLVGQNQATLLTTILRTDELYVYFDVPENDLLEYLRGEGKSTITNPPSIPFAARLPAEGSEWRNGMIDYVEGAVNTGTGTVRARGRIANPVPPSSKVREMFPGMYVQVRVPRGPQRTRPAIPEDAVQTGQEGRFVFVVGEKNIVEKRLVELGPTIWKSPSRPNGHGGGWALVNPDPKPPPPGVKGPPPPTRMRVNSVVSVHSGLSPEDRVIVVGLQKARPTAPVAPEDWQLLPPDAKKPPDGKKPPEKKKGP